MSDAKSLSELRDEWLALADVGKYATELQIERANIREDCAAALAGPIERERRLVEALKLAATRLEILTGRMRACGNHELLEEAVMFCEEARASLVTREHRLVEQAQVMAGVLRDMDEAKWLDEADRILQTRGREALAAWRSLVTPGAAPTGPPKLVDID